MRVQVLLATVLLYVLNLDDQSKHKKKINEFSKRSRSDTFHKRSAPNFYII